MSRSTEIFYYTYVQMYIAYLKYHIFNCYSSFIAEKNFALSKRSLPSTDVLCQIGHEGSS